MIAETGLAVSGPNCMGNVCAKTRFVTFPEDRMLTVKEGPVAMVGQSGGMMLFANGALNERGIVAEYLITSGNEAGLSVGDYIAFFADQPELKVIVIYVEAVSNLETFKAACRMARAAGKHIVALKLGQSEGGRRSGAGAHRLARGLDRSVRCGGGRGRRGARRYARRCRGDDRAARLYRRAEPGAISAPSRCRAHSAACCSTAPRGTACISARWKRRRRTSSTRSSASARWWRNPTDGGYGVLTSADNYINSIDAMQADPNVDIVLVQEQIPREAGSGRAENYVRLLEDYAATRAKKPIAFCAPTSHGHTDFSRALRADAPHVSFLQEANKALRAIAAVARRDELERLARSAEGATAVADGRAVSAHRTAARARRHGSGRAERVRIERRCCAPTASRRRRRSSSRRSTTRCTPPNASAIRSCSRRCRDTLTHKSDVGAVALNLATPEQLRTAYERMSATLADHTLDGMLVGQFVAAGSSSCSACIATARWG